jgi:hypothetical protein
MRRVVLLTGLALLAIATAAEALPYLSKRQARRDAVKVARKVENHVIRMEAVRLNYAQTM